MTKRLRELLNTGCSKAAGTAEYTDWHREVVIELRLESKGGEYRVRPQGRWISSNDYIAGDWVNYMITGAIISAMVITLVSVVYWGVHP